MFPKTCFGCNKNGTSLCQTCIAQTRKAVDVPLPYVTSIFSYQDKLIKKIIHSIKYFHRKDLILPLTSILAEEMNTKNITGVLVPIPMPRLRRYMRGYNQSREIAAILSKHCSLPVDNLLKRTYSPDRQVRMKSRGERLMNQKDSFAITKIVDGIDIILVDDVTTTGSTLREAKRILEKHGARRVRAVTLAH